jgi:HEAT repeat protein
MLSPVAPLADDDASAGAAPSAGGDPAPGGDDAPSLDALLRALADPDPAIRDRAARALGDRRDPRAVPALAAAMAGGRGGRGVVWALTQFDDPALEAALVAALAEPDATARALAAGRLADVGGSDAVPALLAALDDDDDHVREEVARALGLLADPAAFRPLIAAVRDDPGAHVREEAATAVGALGADDPAAVAVLVDALSDGHVAVRRAAAEALARMGPAAQARLRALASGPRSDARDAAAGALAALQAGRLTPAGGPRAVPER